MSFDLHLRTPAGPIHTTGCPIQVNGKRETDDKPAPLLNQDHAKILNDLGVKRMIKPLEGIRVLDCSQFFCSFSWIETR